MKIIFSNLLVIIILVLFSCTNSNVKISTEDNFKIVELPDGSTAYLNNNSSIKYNKYFDERIIEQKGEVFFEVTKGTAPFIVKTEVGEIQVLGTKFNVKSSNKELDVEVEEGIIELKINKFIKEIKKGQKAFFKRNQNSIQISNAELKHKKWLNSLDKELKELGKTILKDSKKIRKDVKKELKKFKKKLN
ncbi:MAG: hypothetical protein GQ564_11045 [Bacteroidales bacterium]|nr:hypothetical protein [Bacteroidales bacterium]